jgi:hypothetical protein
MVADAAKSVAGERHECKDVRLAEAIVEIKLIVKDRDDFSAAVG